MRRSIGRLALVGLVAACAVERRPVPASSPPGDETQIRTVLRDWYQAMQSGDSAGTAKPLTREFLLLEDTLPTSRDQLVTAIVRGKGTESWTADLTDLKTRFKGEVAWTTLRNHETRAAKDRTCTADFLETVVFVREDGRWLIDRYHAAAVNRWSC